MNESRTKKKPKGTKQPQVEAKRLQRQTKKENCDTQQPHDDAILPVGQAKQPQRDTK